MVQEGYQTVGKTQLGGLVTWQYWRATDSSKLGYAIKQTISSVLNEASVSWHEWAELEANHFCLVTTPSSVGNPTWPRPPWREEPSPCLNPTG